MKKLKPATIAAFAALERVEWFHAVGTPLYDEPVVVVKSWAVAVKRASSTAWENLGLRLRGDLTAYLSQHAPARDRQWNRLVDEVKAMTEPLVAAKTARVVAEHDLPKQLVDTVRWDLVNFGMEHEYADLVPLGFFTSLAKWYERGRFPCGWSGKYPAGEPMI
jgi:hypothetical protein